MPAHQGASGGYVAQLARSVGVYGKPIPRIGGGRKRGAAAAGGRDGGGGSGTTPTFSDKERAVIANLEEYTAEGLQQLSESLRMSCMARMDEVKEARTEKRQLQEELADTLARLADTHLASQGAIRAGRNDRLFLKQVVAKYRTLVEHYEMEKQHADLSDPEAFNVIRKLTVKLHDNMHAAQGLSKILDDIEKMRTSIVQLETLLSFHKTDLRIVHAGSKQVLAKAQGHKDALFQALVGLESRLVKARSQREERSKELRVSKQQHDAMSQRLQEEEQAVLEREVVWLQEQLNSARHAAKDGYSPRSKSENAKNNMMAKLGSGGGSVRHMAVGERGGLQVQSLKLQIDQLERELQELRADASNIGGAPKYGEKVRPPTANIDGRDRDRQREARSEHLRFQLSDLRAELASSAGGKGGREKLDVTADISALEHQLESQQSESDVWDEHNKMASELEELEGLLAEREASGVGIESLAVIKRRESAVSQVVALEQRMRDSRSALRQALDKAMTLCQTLTTSISEGVQGMPDGELEGMEKSLKEALAEATSRAREADETEGSIETLLPIAEGTSNARMPGEEASEGRGGKDHGALEQLRHDHVMLEKSVRHQAETNALTQLKLERLKALLNSGTRGGDGSQDVPSQATPPQLHAGAELPMEQGLRKRLAEEKQTQGNKRSPNRNAGTGITKADVAELSALWHMEQGDAPLSWIPNKALSLPLPLGWEEHQDEGGHAFYVEVASGVSSYQHPNDVKYKGIYVEVKNYLDQVQAGGQLEVYGMTADSLEAERLRLREVDNLIDTQEEDLRRKEEAMQQEHLLTAISQEETARLREIEWGKRRDEVLKAEVNRLRHNEGLKLQEAREQSVVELREKHVERERAAIRKMLQDEAEVKLRAERLRVREKLLKEEMLAARRDMELQEKVSLQDERQAMREEIIAEVKEQQLAELGDESERVSAVSQLAQETEKIRLETEHERDKRNLTHQERLDELQEYAKYLGMDPHRKDLLWVAQLALTAPLPSGWSEHVDGKDNVFFFCHATNMSTYQHPMDEAFKAYYDKLAAKGDSEKT